MADEITIKQVNRGYIATIERLDDNIYFSEETIFEREEDLLGFLAEEFDFDTKILLEKLSEIWS